MPPDAKFRPFHLYKPGVGADRSALANARGGSRKIDKLIRQGNLPRRGLGMEANLTDFKPRSRADSGHGVGFRAMRTARRIQQTTI